MQITKSRVIINFKYCLKNKQTNNQTNKRTRTYIICMCAYMYIIGANVSEPHTSVFYCNFLIHYYYYFLSYIVPYILDAVI